jgi:HEAT repeat protein
MKKRMGRKTAIGVTAITPRYKDLFRNMRDSDRARADQAYDAVLFDRAKAAPALIEQYSKAVKDEEMRYLCVQLMGFSEARMVIPTLIDSLDDPSPMVRREACFALEDLRAVDSIDAIRKRTQDMDQSVRSVAEEAYNTLLRRQRSTKKK